MSKLQSAIERAQKLRAQAAERISTSGTFPALDELAFTPDGASAAVASDRTDSIADPSSVLSLTTIRKFQPDHEVFRKHRVLSQDDSEHRAQTSYRMLRTRLVQRMRSNAWRTLGVSSTGPGEGKTLTAVNLAIAISGEIGQDVVLVDLDLRRPSVHKYLGIPADQFVDLRSFLEGDVTSVRDLLLCPGIDRLACILSAAPVSRSSDLLASPAGRLLFQQFREQLPPKTIIVVDLPPLLSTDDALVTAPVIDAMLFVVAEGHAKRKDIEGARELLKEFNIIGTVLNKSVEKEADRYGY